MSLFRVPGRVWLISLPFAIGFSAISAEQQYLVGYLVGEGVSPMAASSALAAIYLAGTLIRFFAIGSFAAVMGGKRAMLLGMAWYIAFPLLTLATQNPIAMILNAGVWGVAAAFAWTAGYAQVLAASNPGAYGAASGLFTSLTSLTQMATVFYWGKPVAAGGFPDLLVFAAVVAAAGWIMAALIPGPPAVEIAAPAPAAPAGVGRLMPISTVALFLSFFASFSWGLVLNHMNHYVAARFGADKVAVTVIGFYVAILIFPFVSGVLSDWLGRRALLAAGFVAGALAMTGAATGVWAAIALSTALLGFQSSAARTVLMAWIGDTTSGSGRTIAIAALTAFSSMGTTISILAGGYLGLGGDQYQWGFAVFGLCFALCAVVASRLPVASSGTRQSGAA